MITSSHWFWKEMEFQIGYSIYPRYCITYGMTILKSGGVEISGGFHRIFWMLVINEKECETINLSFIVGYCIS